jgi:hypothetical protein
MKVLTYILFICLTNFLIANTCISSFHFLKDTDFKVNSHNLFNPKTVKEKNVIFVNADILELFFEHYHILIDHPYIPS